MAMFLIKNVRPPLEFWQTWCMRRTENPENVVRIHKIPQKNGLSGVLLHLDRIFKYLNL